MHLLLQFFVRQLTQMIVLILKYQEMLHTNNAITIKNAGFHISHHNFLVFNKNLAKISELPQSHSNSH